MSKEKTFREIYAGLTAEAKLGVKLALMGGLRVTESTIWRWANGRAVPFAWSQKAAATEIINRILSADYQAEQLFPEK